jgi:benzoylformate decarboxylase
MSDTLSYQQRGRRFPPEQGGHETSKSWRFALGRRLARCHPLYRGALRPAIKPLCERTRRIRPGRCYRRRGVSLLSVRPDNYLPHGTQLVRITDNPSEAARAPVGDSILADPGTACGVLADLVSKATWPTPAPIMPAQAPEARATITADSPYHTINEYRPANSVLVHESMSSLRALKERLPTSSPQSFFASFSGVLCYGLSASAGVAFAERDLETHR